MGCWRRLLNCQFFVMLRLPLLSSLLEESSMNLQAQGIIFCTTFQLSFHDLYIELIRVWLLWFDQTSLLFTSKLLISCIVFTPFSCTKRVWFLHLRVLCMILISVCLSLSLPLSPSQRHKQVRHMYTQKHIYWSLLALEIPLLSSIMIQVIPFLLPLPVPIIFLSGFWSSCVINPTSCMHMNPKETWNVEMRI